MSYFGINRRTKPAPSYKRFNIDFNDESMDQRPLTVMYNGAVPTTKWQGTKDPIAQERKTKKLEPPPLWKTTQKERKYGRMYEEASRAKPGMREALMQAIAAQEKINLDSQVDNQINSETVERFQAWLMGLGKPSDHQKAGWWPKNGARPHWLKQNMPISQHPSVLKYLEQFTERRIRYEEELAKLRMDTSRVKNLPIERLWEIFKFYVLGMDPKEDIEAHIDAYTGRDKDKLVNDRLNIEPDWKDDTDPGAKTESYYDDYQEKMLATLRNQNVLYQRLLDSLSIKGGGPAPAAAITHVNHGNVNGVQAASDQSIVDAVNYMEQRAEERERRQELRQDEERQHKDRRTEERLQTINRVAQMQEEAQEKAVEGMKERHKEGIDVSKAQLRVALSEKEAGEQRHRELREDMSRQTYLLERLLNKPQPGGEPAAESDMTPIIAAMQENTREHISNLHRNMAEMYTQHNDRIVSAIEREIGKLLTTHSNNAATIVNEIQKGSSGIQNMTAAIHTLSDRVGHQDAGNREHLGKIHSSLHAVEDKLVEGQAARLAQIASQDRLTNVVADFTRHIGEELNKLSTTATKFDLSKLEASSDRLNGRVDALGAEVDAKLASKVAEITTAIQQHQPNLAAQNQNMQEYFNRVFQAISGQIAALPAPINPAPEINEGLRQNMQALVNQLNTMFGSQAAVLTKAIENSVTHTPPPLPPPPQPMEAVQPTSMSHALPYHAPAASAAPPASTSAHVAPSPSINKPVQLPNVAPNVLPAIQEGEEEMTELPSGQRYQSDDPNAPNYVAPDEDKPKQDTVDNLMRSRHFYFGPAGRVHANEFEENMRGLSHFERFAATSLYNFRVAESPPTEQEVKGFIEKLVNHGMGFNDLVQASGGAFMHPAMLPALLGSAGTQQLLAAQAEMDKDKPNVFRQEFTQHKIETDIAKVEQSLKESRDIKDLNDLTQQLKSVGYLVQAKLLREGRFEKGRQAEANRAFNTLVDIIDKTTRNEEVHPKLTRFLQPMKAENRDVLVGIGIAAKRLSGSMNDAQKKFYTAFDAWARKD